jgi:Tfp pilus assembly protein PilF
MALQHIARISPSVRLASDEYDRALTLASGDATVLSLSGQFAAYRGHFDIAIPAARRAAV